MKYKCSCGWEGKERKLVDVSEDYWYFVCPNCGEKDTLNKVILSPIRCPKCHTTGMDFEEVYYYYSEKVFVGTITELPHPDVAVTCHKCKHVIQYGNCTH